MAARILSENVGRGLSRMGESHTKGLGYLADATEASALADSYKEAKIAILHEAEVEKAVVNSASILWTNADKGRKNTAAFTPLIDQRASVLLNEVKAAYQLQAKEREAANLVVESVGGGRGGGRGGGGGGAGGGRGGAPAGPSVPQEMNAEFTILLGQHKTVLEIRDFLSGEFTPLPLADLMTVLHAREAAGTVKLVPKTAK
jgi:hypothetical protein